MVIFTSDNGGLSMMPNRVGPTSNLPLRAGKGWCYEGGIRVPLVIRAPAHPRTGAPPCKPNSAPPLDRMGARRPQ